MNINENTKIDNLPKGYSRAHIAHCLANCAEVVKYIYFGKRVRRGIVKIHAKKNTIITAYFDCKDGWVSYLNITGAERTA